MESVCASDRTVIWSDGKPMTTKAKGTDANGAPMTLTVVYEKHGERLHPS